MKKLTSKKGFTLVEMLVVIAIIAVLVAIIIPTVTSATTKAACATNAANLRALVAEATTDYLAGGDTVGEGMVTVTINNDGSVDFKLTSSAPTAKAVNGVCSKTDTANLKMDATSKLITANYNGYTTDDFATGADTGTPSGPSATSE
jgi:prepilin-type N-terminal cleavage/methylation domain-containing protein